MRVRAETGSGRHGAPKARAYRSLGQRPRESCAQIRPGLKARFIPGKPGFQPLPRHRARSLGRWPRLKMGRAFGPLRGFMSSSMCIRTETLAGRHGAPKARAYRSLGQRPRESCAHIRAGLKARFIPGKPGVQPLHRHRAKSLGRWPRLKMGRAFGPLLGFMSSSMCIRTETLAGRHGAPKARAYRSLGQRPRKSCARIRPGLKARFITGKLGIQQSESSAAHDGNYSMTRPGFVSNP